MASGAVLVVAALRYVAETPRRSGQFDLLGAVSGTLGMTPHRVSAALTGGTAILALALSSRRSALDPIELGERLEIGTEASERFAGPVSPMYAG